MAQKRAVGANYRVLVETPWGKSNASPHEIKPIAAKRASIPEHGSTEQSGQSAVLDTLQSNQTPSIVSNCSACCISTAVSPATPPGLARSLLDDAACTLSITQPDPGQETLRLLDLSIAAISSAVDRLNAGKSLATSELNKVRANLSPLPAVLSTAKEHVAALHRQHGCVVSDLVQSKAVLCELTEVASQQRIALQGAREAVHALQAEADETKGRREREEGERATAALIQSFAPPPAAVLIRDVEEVARSNMARDQAEAECKALRATVESLQRQVSSHAAEASYWHGRTDRLDVLVTGLQVVVRAQREAAEAGQGAVQAARRVRMDREKDREHRAGHSAAVQSILGPPQALPHMDEQRGEEDRVQRETEAEGEPDEEDGHGCTEFKDDEFSYETADVSDGSGGSKGRESQRGQGMPTSAEISREYNAERLVAALEEEVESEVPGRTHASSRRA